MKKIFYTTSILCIPLALFMLLTDELKSSQEAINFKVEVCAGSEKSAIEKATYKCIENAGRNCECECKKTSKKCADNTADYTWECGCSRIIHDNW